MSKLFQLIALSALFTLCLCTSCEKPEVNVNSFSTQDATIVSQVAYIAEFDLKCSNNPESISLFAQIDGKVTPVAHIGENKYQVSWNEEIKKSRSGDQPIRLFDEEGFANIRKAQRAGECISTVKSLVDIAVAHPGAYKGPWVNSEFVAVGVVAFVAYFAITSKSKLSS